MNDRWGAGTACKHGDVRNCQDKFSPGLLTLGKVSLKKMNFSLFFQSRAMFLPVITLWDHL